jgi:hypothetical protein
MACVALAACTAEHDGDDSVSAASPVPAASPTPTDELSQFVAQACTTSCDCPSGSRCTSGRCVGIVGVSPGPPPPYCAADCQCMAPTPYCDNAPSPKCQSVECRQSLSSLNLPPGGTATYSWTTAGGGVRVVLLGTKNNVPDETGQTTLPSLSGSFVVGDTPGKAGSYERWISLRDASNVEICKSASIFYTFQ